MKRMLTCAIVSMLVGLASCQWRLSDIMETDLKCWTGLGNVWIKLLSWIKAFCECSSKSKHTIANVQILNINWSLTGYFASTIPRRSFRRIPPTGTDTLVSPSWGSSWGRPDTFRRLTHPLPDEKYSIYSNGMHHSIISPKMYNNITLTIITIVFHRKHRHYKNVPV